MNAIPVKCTSCGHSMHVSASAQGKKLKCSSCSHIMTVPTLSNAEASNDSAPQTSTAIPAAVVDSSIKSCPFCGEDIRVTAVKCKHCGEFLNQPAQGHPQASPPQANQQLGQSYRPHPGAQYPGTQYPGTQHPGMQHPGAAKPQKAPGTMTPAEYIVATLFSPIGLVIGIVWAIQRNAKAKMMLMVSTLCVVISATLVAILSQFIGGGESDNLADYGSGTDDPFVSYYDEYGNEQLYLPSPNQPDTPQQRESRSELQDELDIDDQPLPIQRALRANVRIESSTSLGSGVVLKRESDKAFILTNRHVIDPSFGTYSQRAQPIIENLPEAKVIFYTRQQNIGEIVWVAPDGIDLAIVKSSCPSEIEPVPWYPIQKPMTGEDVFAIGNPSGLNWTYTRGVISALRRRVDNDKEIPIIQTDASIAGGSSGGGLYSKSGQLLGINTFIIDPSQANGLGFAIRLSILEKLAPEILGIEASETVEDDSENEVFDDEASADKE